MCLASFLSLGNVGCHSGEVYLIPLLSWFGFSLLKQLILKIRVALPSSLV